MEFFDNDSRNCFLQGGDGKTIDRARGWALWNALITYHDANKKCLVTWIYIKKYFGRILQKRLRRK